MSISKLAVFAFGAIGSSLALPSLAECPLSQLDLAGTIVGRDKQPIAGAAVEADWDEKRATGIQARTVSDASGAFSLAVQYSTYSGRTFTGNEKCEFKLDSVQLKVSKDGVGAATQEVELTDPLKPVTIELR